MASSIPDLRNQSAIRSADAHTRLAANNSAAQGNSSGGNSASIAANDFLTLLVTEMKNQDPTATTDPNEYVNQLVQVNSLQQLISINETLQKTTPAVSSTSSTARVNLGEAQSSSVVRAEGNAQRGSIADVAGTLSTNQDIANSKQAALRVATALTR